METETGRQVGALADAGAFALFATLLLVAATLTRTFARRLHTGEPLAFLALASIALIVAFTLRPQDVALWLGDVIRGGDPLPGSSDWAIDPRLWERATRLGTGWLLNAALFLPAGLIVGLATGRPLRTLLWLVVLSMALELVQGLTSVGSADPSDLVANSVGAAVGVSLAGAMRFVRPLGSDGAGGRHPWSRIVALALTTLAVVALVGVTFSYVADTRRSALLSELSDVFEGSTSEEVGRAIDSANGFIDLLDRASVRPDYIGRIGSSSEIEARYTTQFLGLYRCVFVRWDATGFDLRSAAGGACSTFRDTPESD